MSFHSTVAIYPTFQETEDAIHQLTDNGFSPDQISVTTHDMQSEKHIRGYVTAADIATQGAMEGAWIGGLMGLIFGAALIWIPRLGLIVEAGTFGDILLGMLEGAAFGVLLGALFGALVGWFISKKHILKYDEQFSGGRHYLEITGSWQDVKRAHELLQGEDLASVDIQNAPTERSLEFS